MKKQKTTIGPQSAHNRNGFSLVELIVIIAIIAILSAAVNMGIQSIRSESYNKRLKSDITAITNSLEQFRMDHHGKFPIPEPGGNMNVLCYHADATYAHDCATAVFRQGMIDNNLLTKRYLREVPTDPRTGSRYVYGVSNDGKFFQVAGIFKEDDGSWTAYSAGNLKMGYHLPSLIRAFNGPDFVVNKGQNLPYSPEHMIISATLQNMTDASKVIVEDKDGGFPAITPGMTVYSGYTVSTTTGTVDLYFSDGSVTGLDTGTTLEIKSDSGVAENDSDNIITGIRLFITTGKIWNKVARLASASEFKVETTTAIAGVRGTEFGIDADSDIIIVRSGEVEIEGVSISATPDAPKQADLDDPTNIIPVDPVVETWIDSFYEIKLNEGQFVPYVPHFISGSARENYKIFVSFNSLTMEDILGLNSDISNGFELFGGSQTRGYRVMKPGALDDPLETITDVVYDEGKKLYSFELDYGNPAEYNNPDVNNRDKESIILRAFKQDAGGNRIYSELSWPLTGFGNPKDSLTFVSFGLEEYFPFLTETVKSCRDGFHLEWDNCVSNIMSPECGDGTVNGDEVCDDGNVNSGDGCSDICQEEAGYTCTGTPSVCTADAAQLTDINITGDSQPFTGTTYPYTAIAYYDDDSSTVITGVCGWAVDPTAAGTFDAHRFTPAEAGTAAITCDYDTMTGSLTAVISEPGPTLAQVCGEGGGTMSDGACWKVAESTEDTCEAICTGISYSGSNLACTDGTWDVSVACGDLGYAFDSVNDIADSYGPILALGINECKNTTANSNCLTTLDGPYLRICKCPSIQ